MAVSTGQIRAQVLHRMAGAQEAGKTASAFLRDMQAVGLGYRRTTFLADWRSVGNIEEKTGLIRYVRKDYQPSPRLYADVSWELSREYLYKIKVQTRLAPGEPLEERFVNIVTDKPMTPGELETEVSQQWGGWYPERREEIEAIIPETAVRRIG